MINQRYEPRHALRRSRRALAATSVLAVAAVPVAVIAAAGPANASLCASAAGKCFTLSVSPSAYAAGATIEFTVAVGNESSPGQSLGSSNVDAPAGYAITHVGSPSSGTATQVGNEVQLRNMALAPGSTDTVTVTATTPDAGGSGTWTATAKQSNDYNGAGNDFVFDAANSSTITTGTSGASPTDPKIQCSNSDVSCGANWIDYRTASDVYTGKTVSPTVWLIGHMHFPASSCTATACGQVYRMEAPSQPGNFCPVNGAPAQCTFEMKVDTIPAPYDANHAATLTLTCDASKCGSNTVPVMFKKDDSGNVSPLPLCTAVTNNALCYSSSTDSLGNQQIVISNITAGDPSFAGQEVPPDTSALPV